MEVPSCDGSNTAAIGLLAVSVGTLGVMQERYLCIQLITIEMCHKSPPVHEDLHIHEL